MKCRRAGENPAAAPAPPVVSAKQAKTVQYRRGGAGFITKHWQVPTVP